MRIAICDDEKRICAILAEKVGKICRGAEIMTYASGKELLGTDILPDILLLDIKMPGMSGMDVARTLRDRDWRKILIFITGEEDQVFNSFDLQAFHFLVKPVADEKLKEVLENAVKGLERSGAESGKHDKYIDIQSGTSHIIMTGALLSADTSRQFSQVQSAVKGRIDGQAGVLDAEIKLDSTRGGGVTKKKEELEETQKKAAELAETTINTLTTANEDLKKATKEDLEAQRAEKAAEKKKAEKAAEKKKAEKEAAEERIEKAKVSTSESGEVSDETASVSTEGTVLDGASIDIVSSGITVSTGAVSEPEGKNVDVKV
ncbi:MAG: response regulator [Lachnospiraceae bacterium]|nr:response regulator [Lachnospiraceae bacterium]